MKVPDGTDIKDKHLKTHNTVETQQKEVVMKAPSLQMAQGDGWCHDISCMVFFLLPVSQAPQHF